MSKWEDKYEKLKSGEFNDRIDELKQKVEDRNATREELKEYKTLSKSKENLNQVNQIIIQIIQAILMGFRLNRM